LKGGIVRPIHGPHPFALARCGASLRLSKFAPGEFVEPVTRLAESPVLCTHSLRQIPERPRSGAFWYLAERVSV